VCLSNESRVYIQYKCDQTTIQIANKELSGLKVTILELATYFLLVIFIFFNVSKTKKMGKIYDDLNVTASDYSLYFRMTDKFMMEFYNWQPTFL